MADERVVDYRSTILAASLCDLFLPKDVASLNGKGNSKRSRNQYFDSLDVLSDDKLQLFNDQQRRPLG